VHGSDSSVAVIGGGVVGCAVAHALARRGVSVIVLEAEPGLGLGASGANSGILHTGFDSPSGELETRLILRAAELRGELLGELGVRVWRCGARLQPAGEEQRTAVAKLSANARANGVEAELDDTGALRVPGEAITDPVAFVQALAAAASLGGTEIRLSAEVVGLGAKPTGGISVGLRGGEDLRVAGVVNCAGLYADEVARLAGEEPVRVYPRKGEFLVFRSAVALQEILLPVPSSLGKGVLVFPSLDGHVIAGPTAREREDKTDWSVEADTRTLIEDRAREMFPALAAAELVDRYAGLRPAGREANYVIEHSGALPGLIHVAAIRSTGLSASLGIGEHVAAMVAEIGEVELGAVRALPVPLPTGAPGPWWRRAALHHAETERGQRG
jgi:glycerol-3-phosphate dehydrogenase